MRSDTYDERCGVVELLCKPRTSVIHWIMQLRTYVTSMKMRSFPSFMRYGMCDNGMRHMRTSVDDGNLYSVRQGMNARENGNGTKQNKASRKSPALGRRSRYLFVRECRSSRAQEVSHTIDPALLRGHTAAFFTLSRTFAPWLPRR